MGERDIEQNLVQDITKLQLRLGTGFAFLGNQYNINVRGIYFIRVFHRQLFSTNDNLQLYYLNSFFKFSNILFNTI